MYIYFSDELHIPLQITYITAYTDTHTHFHFKILHNFTNKDLESRNILFLSLDRRVNVYCHHLSCSQVPACKHKSKNESIETHKRKK